MVCYLYLLDVQRKFSQRLTVFGRTSDDKQKRYRLAKNCVSNFNSRSIWLSVQLMQLTHSDSICARLEGQLRNNTIQRKL